MSKKKWPIVYSNLLYKMGHYFLDRRYFFPLVGRPHIRGEETVPSQQKFWARMKIIYPSEVLYYNFKWC